MHRWQMLKRNPRLWERYFVRERIIQEIRRFFQSESFHEVETPLLVSSVIPAPYLEMFQTDLLSFDKKKRETLYLSTSPEASLKKLVASGIGNCFEITKSFRNGEVDSPLHNPEFTILEWYRVNADYTHIMTDCENLILFILKKRKRPKKPKNEQKPLVSITYQGSTIDFSSPWKRISVDEACRKYANFSLSDLSRTSSAHNSLVDYPLDNIAALCRKKGYVVKPNNTWEVLFNQIYLNEIEPKLARIKKPIFLYDYPLPLAALSKRKEGNPLVAERFELTIGGVEIGNCFTELTDPKEQKRRFQKDVRATEKTHVMNQKPDWNFIEALKEGLPPCSGIALGIDRLVMVLTDAAHIRDVLLFPSADMIK